MLLLMYDIIVVGAGAAGLFVGACSPGRVNGLILEKSKKPGVKLLMSGSGQCNFTHSGSIKDFLSKYGNNGKKLRSALYKFNNLALIDYFESKGVKSLTRDDGKVFPASLKASDIRDVLLSGARENGFEIMCDSAVLDISHIQDENTYIVETQGENYKCRKLIIATGGCSYPKTGSAGSMFPILEKMGFNIIPPKPALTPIFVHDYPFSNLSGISFSNVEVTIVQQSNAADCQNAVGFQSVENSGSVGNAQVTGNFKDVETSRGIKDFPSAENSQGAPAKSHDIKAYKCKSAGALLFTHECFSGPAVLDTSRFAEVGFGLHINYMPEKAVDELIGMMKTAMVGNKKSLRNFLTETFDLPSRFVDAMLRRSPELEMASTTSLSKKHMKIIAELLTNDSFVIKDVGGFGGAMVTSGGVNLDDVDLKTFESKQYPNLHIVGEALDVDGDTGGYNLQFAFSSAYGSVSCL